VKREYHGPRRIGAAIVSATTGRSSPVGCELTTVEVNAVIRLPHDAALARLRKRLHLSPAISHRIVLLNPRAEHVAIPGTADHEDFAVEDEHLGFDVRDGEQHVSEPLPFLPTRIVSEQIRMRPVGATALGRIHRHRSVAMLPPTT
jgi:hypothetical protein